VSEARQRLSAALEEKLTEDQLRGRRTAYAVSVAGERPDDEPRASFEIVPSSEIGDTPAVYANFVQGTVTPFDLTLHFGWYAIPPFTKTPSDTVPVPVRPVVKVSIPLSLVRGVMGMMEKQLEAWQDAFGQPAPDQPSPQHVEEESRQ